MSNRVLRDWTDSYRISELDAETERLFVRLIMKADDFGRYHGSVAPVKAGCFPLLTSLRDTDISRWLAACEKAGLLVIYDATYKGQSRKYLAIKNFKQRLRQMKAQFPPPDGHPPDWRPNDDGQPPDNRPSIDGQSTARNETKGNETTPPDGGSSSETKSAAERFADARSQATCWITAEMPSFLRKPSVEAFTSCILAWGRDKAIATVNTCVKLPSVHDPFAYAAGILREQEKERAGRNAKTQRQQAPATTAAREDR